LWVYQYLGLKKHFFTTIIDKASNTFTQNSGSEQNPSQNLRHLFAQYQHRAYLKRNITKAFFAQVRKGKGGQSAGNNADSTVSGPCKTGIIGSLQVGQSGLSLTKAAVSQHQITKPAFSFSSASRLNSATNAPTWQLQCGLGLCMNKFLKGQTCGSCDLGASSCTARIGKRWRFSGAARTKSAKKRRRIRNIYLASTARSKQIFCRWSLE
jgi:hypothetical protein